jgi:hypothetical protein
MIYINGHWETINSLQDVSRIVREYFSDILADELDDLIEAQENEIAALKQELDGAYADDDWWGD